MLLSLKVWTEAQQQDQTLLCTFSALRAPILISSIAVKALQNHTPQDMKAKPEEACKHMASFPFPQRKCLAQTVYYRVCVV